MQSILSLFATLVAVLPGLTSPSGIHRSAGAEVEAMHQHVIHVQSVSHTDSQSIELEATTQDEYHPVATQEEKNSEPQHVPTVKRRTTTQEVIRVDLDNVDPYVTQDVDAVSRTLPVAVKQQADNELSQLFALFGITE